MPPLNLVGDFGGGALYLAFGLLAGVIHARATGQGQVIDCAMTDGAASLMAMFYGMSASGMWTDQRSSNLLDGGAQFYDTYEYRRRPVHLAGLDRAAVLRPAAGEGRARRSGVRRRRWTAPPGPTLKAKLAAVIKTKSRDEWCAIMDATDVCFAPVLEPDGGAQPSAQRRAQDLRRGGRA